MQYIISETIEVKIGGRWIEAEILEIFKNYARVYRLDTGEKITVNLDTNARHY